MLHLGRVTHKTIYTNSLGNMNRALSDMVKTQQQYSSGKMISKPSDNPAGTGAAMGLRNDKANVAKYRDNADNGLSWLNTIDTALSTTTERLQRARDLAVRGASTGSMNQGARDALASEIEGIRDSLMEQANTKYLGRNVFAGTSNASFAFDSATYTFNGTNTPVERRVGDAVTLRVDENGADIFGTGTDPNAADYSVFRLMDEMAATLRAGGSTSNAINQIDSRLETVLNRASAVGARALQVEQTITNSRDKSLTLAGDLAKLEEVDVASMTVDLKAKEVAYQVALQATSMINKHSLLDYM